MQKRPSLISGDIFTSHEEHRTLKAWKPYSLCLGVLFQIQNSEVETRWSGWLLPWIAGLTLLRTTGHVLEKIDAKTSSKHKQIIDARWSDLRIDKERHWIFWNFILQERNNLLKEFEFGFVTAPYLEPEEYEIEASVYEKMDLFREAVYWWRQELRQLEMDIHKKTPRSFPRGA